MTNLDKFLEKSKQLREAAKEAKMNQFQYPGRTEAIVYNRDFHEDTSEAKDEMIRVTVDALKHAKEELMCLSHDGPKHVRESADICEQALSRIEELAK